MLPTVIKRGKQESQENSRNPDLQNMERDYMNSVQFLKYDIFYFGSNDIPQKVMFMSSPWIFVNVTLLGNEVVADVTQVKVVLN